MSAVCRPDHLLVSWIDILFAPRPALAISAGLLSLLVLLSWWGAGRRLAMAISIVLFARYMLWRGLFTLNLDHGLGIALSATLLVAETYGFVQFLLFSYQAWSPTDRKSPPLATHPTVDVMVTVVNEPLYILKRTLIGCLNQEYPKHRYRVHVLDDGGRDEARALAESRGVS
jgi:cellulose synthase (UDP-forming)